MKQSIAVIVPCRNEELYIARCLDSILENDYPNELLEVIIVDGMSTDKTREIIAGYKNRFKSIKTIDNIKKTKPAAPTNCTSPPYPGDWSRRISNTSGVKR